MHKINTLQAGRALAAIAVAAFHLSGTMKLERYGGNAAFIDYTGLGYKGVDFFFVLSGFIILFAHHADIGQPARLGSYLRKRFIRLFPIYWIYTIPFVALLALGFGTEASYPKTGEDWLTSFSLLRFSDASPPLPQAWTLFHEVAFYALFAVLVLHKRLGIILMAAWALICLTLFHYPTTGEHTSFNTYTAAYNLYFLLGMGAYWLYRRGGPGWVEIAAGAILAAIALSAMATPPVSSLLLASGLAVLLAGGAKLEVSGKLSVPPLLLLIGDASYSLYLLHEALQGLLLKIALKTPLYQLVGAESTYLLVMAGTIALSCIAYLTIEKPLISWLRRKPAQKLASYPSVA